MYTITVTQKGQVVIPAKIRKKLHIKKGTKLNVDEDGAQIFMRPANAEYIGSLRGILKSKENLSEILLQERRKDSEFMDRKFKKWLK